MALKDIREDYQKTIDELYSSREKFTEFLNFSGRFYKLPSAQTMAVFKQNSNAVMVADYDTWQHFGRQVKRGEISISYISGNEIKHCFEISQTYGKRQPLQWAFDRENVEKFKENFSAKYHGNFASLTSCVNYAANEEVNGSFDKITDNLGITNGQKSKFLTSVRSMVRQVMVARCEYKSKFKAKTAPLDLSALDMLHSKAEFEKLCEWVQQTAKSALLKIEKSVRKIDDERSLQNERSKQQINGNSRNERQNVQARPDNSDVLGGPDNNVLRGGAAASEEPDRKLGTGVAEVYGGELPIRDSSDGNESAVRNNGAESERSSGENVRASDGTVGGNTPAQTDNVHGDSTVGEAQDYGVQTSGNGGHSSQTARNLSGDTYITDKQQATLKAEDNSPAFSFSEQVDKVVAGKANNYDSIKVCDTPQIFLDIGCRQLPMLYTQQHLRDALKPKSKSNSHHHGLSVEQIKTIPEFLVKPAIIFDSITPNARSHGSIVAVLNTYDSDKAPIIVSIVPNGKGQYQLQTIDSNFITSIYGKDKSFDQYIRKAAEADKILFWDKEKSQELFKFQGLQLPEAFNNLDSDTIIHQSRNIVNTFSEKKQNNFEDKKSSPETSVSNRLELNDAPKDSPLLPLTVYSVGDFYEFYNEDAQITSVVLNLALTDRRGVPMTGIPRHALEKYREQLAAKGYDLKIDDQRDIENILSSNKAERNEANTENKSETVLKSIVIDLTPSSDVPKQKHIELRSSYLEGEQLSLFDDTAQPSLFDETPQEDTEEKYITDNSSVESAKAALVDYAQYFLAYHDGTIREAFLSGNRENFDNAVRETVSATISDVISGELDIAPELSKIHNDFEVKDTFKEDFLELYKEMYDDREFASALYSEILDTLYKKHIEIDKARQAAHAVGLPFDEYPYDSEEEFNPYLYDPNRMSDEDYDLMLELIEKDRANAAEVTETAVDDNEKLTDSEAQPRDINVTAENYVIEAAEQTSFGQKSRFAANIAAIKTLKQIESENRAATPEEQKTLSQYVGWGGIPQAFDSGNQSWAKEYAELKELLTDEEYKAAQGSTLNAHYTSQTVIKAIYTALGNMGFKSGNILEPSMGIGNFFGCMPEEIRGSKLYGVELDSITGRIAQKLYPNADIQIKGFEKADFPDNFFDAAVGNVPFGNYKIADKRYDKENFNIHDYFFAKALDKVAPGGVIAFVTSKGTLDKQGTKAREYLAKRADLIGAIRLPNNAFKNNANTEVTSDIIFLQKREKLAVELSDWVYTAQNDDGIMVNQYFIDHPEMILGKMEYSSNMYGNEKETACVPFENVDLKNQLNTAVSHLKTNIAVRKFTEENNKQLGIIPATSDVRNFTYTIVEDKMYFRENNIMTEVPETGARLERMKALHELRNVMRSVISAQENSCSDDELNALQHALNERYDEFISKFGNVNSRENSAVFSDDDDYNILCALEKYDNERKTYSKSDIFTTRTIKPFTEITHVDTPQEALQVSLDIKGKIDVTYMSQLCGDTAENVIKALSDSGQIYLNPDKFNADEPLNGYEQATEYLSGNVRDKLDNAKAFAANHPEYQRNVTALENVIPETIEANNIYTRIGANWIDIEDYSRFMREYAQAQKSIMDTLRRTPSGEYKIDGKTFDKGVAAVSSFGTSRMNSYCIFEQLLNNRDIVVRDRKDLPDDKHTYVVNQKETQLAQGKATLMKEAFQKWLWDNPDRRKKYVERYNRLFNSIVGREYDGSHQTFPGMSPFIKLTEHQLNAVQRTKLGGNTLLAHCVGAGKSFEMVAATMEKKRLGLINKACVVVPKPLVRQMASEWLRLYPEADILVAGEKDFSENNRQKFIGRCCTGNYAAVIMSYEQFEKIPMSQEYQQKFLYAELDKIDEGIKAAGNDRGRSTKDLARIKKNIEAKIAKMLNAKTKDDPLTFEQLGFDALVVDEAHNYKNGLVVTKMSNVAGVQSTPAQKSEDILMKTQYLNELSGYKNVIFASGTPVSNSMVELYTMQRYLRPDLLQKAGLDNFDDWASTFGEVVSQLEPTPDGLSFRQKKRFSKFANLPELMKMYKEFADIRTPEMLNLPVPKLKGGKAQTIVAKPNEFQQAYVQQLAKRSEAIHSGNVDPTVDNMLKITHEARLLGLDSRCINPDAEDDPNSKVNMCVDKVVEIYKRTADKKGVQAIFCDVAVNGDKEHFSVYNAIKDALIKRGVPEKEICFAGDAKNEKQRVEMFSQLNSGEKRIVLASTSKMGTGANFQQKLCALHHLDIPWKPSDLEQRNGRILRRGNENSEVEIYNYLTEKTFDSYMMSIIVNKQKFISQIMSGKTPARTCQDVDEMVLNYSEMQAIASGDLRIKEKLELDNEVARLRLLESEYFKQRFSLQDTISHCEIEVKRLTEIAIPKAKSDLEFSKQNVLTEGNFLINLEGKEFTERTKAGEELRREIIKVQGERQSKDVGEYCGFTVGLSYDGVGTPMMSLHRDGGLMYYAETNLQTDLGNITRLENLFKDGIENKLNVLNDDLDKARADLAEAQRTVNAPFEYADELREKSARLEQLDRELNIDKVDEITIGDEDNHENGSKNVDPKKPNKPKHGRR